MYFDLCTLKQTQNKNQTPAGSLSMMGKKETKAFANLIDEVHACRCCERMNGSARVLSFAAGNLRAKIMFIGEAPGRLGADLTEIPFHGDAAGHNFEDLLAFARIRREEIFITNAVLCNPKNSQGNNATPNLKEITNCSGFLRRQIELIAPAIVVSLGSVALQSTTLIEKHSLTLREHVRTAHPWFERMLIPLYHPGQRAMVHRSLANQRSDYQFVGEHLRRLNRPQKSGGGTLKKDILAACHYLLARKEELSYFELHKLAYLAEYLHVRATGRRLTNAFFIRQKEGPYCTDLHIARLKRADPQIKLVTKNRKLYVRLELTGSLSIMPEEIQLQEEFRKTLDEVIERYTYENDSDLKRAVYLTAPMRLILRREKYEKINLYNTPIDFLTANSM